MTAFGYNILGFGAGANNVPLEKSMTLESSGPDYLEMSDANFGAYNRAKFGLSLWYKKPVNSADFAWTHSDNGDRGWDILFTSGGKITFQVSQDGTSYLGTLTTTSTSYAGDSTWRHLVLHYDSANGTPGDRMRMWIDGSEVTAFDTDTNPTAQMFDTSAPVLIGTSWTRSTGDSFSGSLYQVAFFSGTLPNAATIYNSGVPIDITGQAGLWSWVNPEDDTTFSDRVLASSWTETGTVVTSSVDIP